MTKSLETAFAKAAMLPKKEQDALAAFLLEELASEERWDKQFAASQDELATLAREAIGEFKAGKTKLLVSVRRRSPDLADHATARSPMRQCARSGDRRTTERDSSLRSE
jgi:hypothetical protein